MKGIKDAMARQSRNLDRDRIPPTSQAMQRPLTGRFQSGTASPRLIHRTTLKCAIISGGVALEDVAVYVHMPGAGFEPRAVPFTLAARTGTLRSSVAVHPA
jgi:hypothetical protein